MRSLFGNLHSNSSFLSLSGLAPGRTARGSGAVWFVVCLFAGTLQAASLAWPWQAWVPPGLQAGGASGWLQIASLSALVLALRHVHRIGQAFWRAGVFATAWMAGSFWWLFISMHSYGGLPVWLAALAVLTLAALLALFYAIAAGLLCGWAPRSRPLQALLFASLWTLAELTRGSLFTGFPWGAGGYAQVDLMVAWAPWVGVYGMGWLAALMAYALALGVAAMAASVATFGQPRPRALAKGAPSQRRVSSGLHALGLLQAVLVALVLGGLLFSLLGREAWRDLGQRDTRSTGDLRVWLLQGNIPQNEKFVAGTGVAQALAWYPQQLADALQAVRGGAGDAPQLVVGPETAFPLLPQQLGPEFWGPLLQRLGEQQQLAFLMGLPLGSYEKGYTNSAWGMAPQAAARAGAAPATDAFYRYDKQHLVPFGEFIPPLARWFTELMQIPLGDFNRGALPQPSWSWAGQRIAPNICFEDLFGEELAAAFGQPGGAPTVLVNLSNIGWFDDSVVIDQHLHISRLRALELGRPMLRATNTGATAAINHRGEVIQSLPRLTRGRLAATVQGRDGLTPYARWASRWGQAPLWGVCLAVLALAVALRRIAPRRMG